MSETGKRRNWKTKKPRKPSKEDRQSTAEDGKKQNRNVVLQIEIKKIQDFRNLTKYKSQENQPPQTFPSPYHRTAAIDRSWRERFKCSDSLSREGNLYVCSLGWREREGEGGGRDRASDKLALRAPRVGCWVGWVMWDPKEHTCHVSVTPNEESCVSVLRPRPRIRICCLYLFVSRLLIFLLFLFPCPNF